MSALALIFSPESDDEAVHKVNYFQVVATTILT